MRIFQIIVSVTVAWAAVEVAIALSAEALQTLPLPPEAKTSRTYRVFINGQEAPVVVEQTANRPVESAAFLFDGSAEIRIVINTPFDVCQIRPLRFGLTEQAKITANGDGEPEVRFVLDEPRRLVIDVDDLPHLVLIGSRPDVDLPQPGDPNVIYFGPGIHEPGRIRVQSNQTVFLDAGAKVYGTIEGTCVENVRITGRGRLYGTKHTDWNRRTYGIVFDRSRNITVEKIGVRDCYWWTTMFLLCDDVIIRDVNLISFNRNNGGLMIDGCRNLRVLDSLLMSRDDCICPHALNAAGNGEVVSQDMQFEDLVLYNFYDGNAIRIGASFETREVRNWRFNDIDVVHRAGAAIYADHSDWATVRNLIFENFTDEPSHGNAVDMRIGKTGYSCQTGYRDERGKFDGVFFLNLRTSGAEIAMKGFDREHGFDNVVFADCWVGDRLLQSREDIQTNEFVRNLRFASDAALISIPSLPALDKLHDRGASPQELILDDGDAAFRSYGFADAGTVEDAYGGDAKIGRVIDKFGQYAAAIYAPGLEGRYEIYAHWGTHSGMDERSPWIIRHRHGYSRAYLDQNAKPGWHALGTFDLTSDSDVRLVYPNYFEPTRRPVVADAVKFVRCE